MSRFEGTTRPHAARGSRHVRPVRRHGRGGGGSRWAGGSEAKSKWSSTRSATPRPALLRITGAELWPRLGSLTPCVFMSSRRGACLFCGRRALSMSLRTASARNSKRGGGGVWKGGRRRREGECVCGNILVQPSVACHCQPVAQRATWLDNKATSSTFSMFCVGVSVNGQF